MDRATAKEIPYQVHKTLACKPWNDLTKLHNPNRQSCFIAKSCSTIMNPLNSLHRNACIMNDAIAQISAQSSPSRNC